MNYLTSKTATTLLVSCILGTALNTANASTVDHSTSDWDPRTALSCSLAKQECIELAKQAHSTSMSRGFFQMPLETLPTHTIGDNYELVKNVSGYYWAKQTIEIETAGTYEIILSDLGLSGDLMKLKAMLYTDDDRLLRISGSGSMTFDAVPGTYYLNMRAMTGWFNNQGDFSVTIQPSSVSSVPVPAAAWLFASGLIGLAGLLRKKS